MRRRNLILAGSVLVAGVAAAAMLCIIGDLSHANAGPEAPAAELRVCPSGCAYSSVQAAVDDADPGDVIKVAQGTYSDVHARDTVTQVVYISKSVTIRGGYTTANWATPDPEANPTTLDAQGRGRVFYVTDDAVLTIEGLHITGGDATSLGGFYAPTDAGGGIYVYNAALVSNGNAITSNTADMGGGLFVRYSDRVTLNGNTITSNTAATESGAGLWVGDSTDVTLHGNTVAGNDCPGICWGGGVRLGGSTFVTVTDNLIHHNVALNGGGLLLDRCVDATASGNRIISNTAYHGGGVKVYFCAPLLSGNIITGNTATSGGGLYLEGSSPRLVNNVVTDNRATSKGPGVYVDRSIPRLLHTTIARNTGGDGSGVHVTGLEWHEEYESSRVVMTNTIIANHTVGITASAGNTVTPNATLWHANDTERGGDGLIHHTNDRSGDPAFAADGYHLTSDSLALDRGVNAGVTTDIDGESRPDGGGYDLGADEFLAPPPNVVWDKHIRINGGSLEEWDSGPFTVTPGDLVAIVDRVWVTTTENVSLTLGEAWSQSLAWESSEATVGAVSHSARAATWAVTDGSPTTWLVLTKTLRAIASPDYADTLTETLVVRGATYAMPERMIEFQQPRPRFIWDKKIRINGGAPQAWNAEKFTVAPGDAVDILDQVWITHTRDVTFKLQQAWGTGLDLDGWDSDAGAVTSGARTLTWDVIEGPANRWHTLTTTVRARGTDWLYEAITETLTVEDTPSQPSQRVVDLLNRGVSTGCYARVNDEPTTYPTVQSAVDAAQSGDLVKVAGTCTDVNRYGGLAQVAYLDKSVTIRGGYTTANWTTPDPEANPTTLDAQGRGRVFYVADDAVLTIEGLHITGGDADGLGGLYGAYDVGGAIYARNAALISNGNTITSNAADIGGGLFVDYSDRVVLNSTSVSSNTAAAGSGGGVYVAQSTDVTLHGNTIAGNECPGVCWGGGVHLGGSISVTLTDNLIQDNAGDYGGGLLLDRCDATVSGNRIIANTAYQGGGVMVYFSDPVLSGNIITGNTATSGGGLYLEGNSPKLVNNVVTDNRATAKGSGVYVDRSSPNLLHTTIARNTGGDGSGVHVTGLEVDEEYVASHVIMTNTIIASHPVGLIVTERNTATLNATLWHANTTDWDGTVSSAKDYSGDPAFAADGYHLALGSAALDRGVDDAVTSDIDGDARPQEGGYDIGADELLVQRVHLPLVVRGR